MIIQYDMFVDPNDFIDKVISDEDPYVKILGEVAWSPQWNQFCALAQYESMLVIVGLKLTENGKPLYISAADKDIHDTAARYK